MKLILFVLLCILPSIEALSHTLKGLLSKPVYGEKFLGKQNTQMYLRSVSTTKLPSEIEFRKKPNGPGEAYLLSSATQLSSEIEFQDQPNKKILLISSNIKSSLFATGIEQGLTSNTVMKLVDIYKDLDIDFKKDTTPESRLEVLLERSFDHQNGKEKVLYTSLTIRKKTVSLYYYKLQDGKERYFNKEGISLKNNTFFIKPLNGDHRISSKFGNRKHPIHGHIAFHKGVDYAAKFGTSIYAAADGVIEYIENNGGYGKYIRIKHKNDYATCYAHISKFNNDIKLDSKVRQGQVIAYVGSTGNATGPHLHYEVIHHGKHIDPLGLEYKIEMKLLNHELKEFKLFMCKVDEVKQKLKNTNASL